MPVRDGGGWRNRRGWAAALPPVVLALLVSACAGGPHGAARWDGRRGYDGNGDYGYDLAASRQEAARYRARAAARSYPVPGPPEDPWGPYIREAAARHGVPEHWIREVMRQESGGRPDATSPAGAMGLMQVMPATYAVLRRRHGLGDDPYEPRDNILAGAAYLREMYDRFGAPNFLAAYNAGPERVEAWLAGITVLPDETEAYLARLAPRIGGGAMLAMAEPPMSYGGYAAGPPDPADRAFDGGGLVTPWAPTGDRTGQVAVVAAARAEEPAAAWSRAGDPAPAARLVPVRAPWPGGWGIQVGAFPDPAVSRAAVAAARSRLPGLLSDAPAAILPVQRDGTLYRARLLGLSAEAAAAACGALARGGMDCFPVPPGS